MTASRRARAQLLRVVRLVMLVGMSAVLSLVSVAEAAEQEIRNPEVLIYASQKEPSSLDPGTDPRGIAGEVIFNVYETLVSWDPEDPNILVPHLCLVLPSIENGLVTEHADGIDYVFPIRSDVTFHNGADLTAEDVEYTFERLMLQDTAGRFLLEAVLGVGSMEELVEQHGELAASEMVRAAVWVQSTNVVVRLVAPFTPFLQILAHPLSSILDKQWAIQQGAWPGTSEEWRHWQYDDSLRNEANGTGPFMFDRWVQGDRLVLTRHDDYWRTAAELEQFVIQFVPEPETRLLMLQHGDADIVALPREHDAELRPWVEEGTVSRVGGLPLAAQHAMFFTQAVDPSSPYIGTGRLDGEGIPPDFFSDVDIRRAVSYAFDWGTYLEEAFSGEARQSTGPIPEDLFGFGLRASIYYYDLAQAEYLFRRASGGTVWNNGFRFAIVISEAARERLIAAEILKWNIESLNPRFRVDVVEVPGGTYSELYTGRQLPIFVTGWLGDYHDPHNWAYAFLHSDGFFPQCQGIDRPQWDLLVEQAACTSNGEERNEVYRELQWEAYDQATAVFLHQPLETHYYRSWVQGWYHNAAYPMGSPGIYAWLYRKAQPAAEFIVRFGQQAYDSVISHGAEAVNIVLAYGAAALDAILGFGKDAVAVISAYSGSTAASVAEYGQDELDVLKRYGLEGARTSNLGRDIASLLKQTETWIRSFLDSFPSGSGSQEDGTGTEARDVDGERKLAAAEELYHDVIVLATLVAEQRKEVIRAREGAHIAAGFSKPIADWATNAMSAYAGGAVDINQLGLVPGDSLGLGGMASVFARSQELAEEKIETLTRQLYHAWDAMWRAYKGLGMTPPSIPNVGEIGPIP